MVSLLRRPKATRLLSLASLLAEDILPWAKDLSDFARPECTVRGICLRQEAYEGLLVLPRGDEGRIFAEAKGLALRGGDIVIHRCNSNWSIHYVSATVIKGLPCLISTMDFRLRVKPGVDAKAVFCQLVSNWRPASPFNIRGYCADAMVDPAVKGKSSRLIATLEKAARLRSESEAMATGLEKMVAGALRGRV